MKNRIIGLFVISLFSGKSFAEKSIEEMFYHSLTAVAAYVDFKSGEGDLISLRESLSDPKEKDWVSEKKRDFL
jgi:hypothetical protein